jgi:hypothetical protein
MKNNLESKIDKISRIRIIKENYRSEDDNWVEIVINNIFLISK